jgi:N-methylhydantoinase A
VSPQFREFERFTTAAMNAFIGPKVRDYVNRLEGALGEAGFKADLHVMGSNGGIATAKMVSERPVWSAIWRRRLPPLRTALPSGSASR